MVFFFFGGSVGGIGIGIVGVVGGVLVCARAWLGCFGVVNEFSSLSVWLEQLEAVL